MNVYKIGDRVRGIPGRTDWAGYGTVMEISGEQLRVWEDDLATKKTRTLHWREVAEIAATSRMAKLPQWHRSQLRGKLRRPKARAP